MQRKIFKAPPSSTELEKIYLYCRRSVKNDYLCRADKSREKLQKSIDWCDLGALDLSHLVLKIDYK